MTSLEKGLRDFAQFAAKLKGDEKSEAQTFLFHLLAAFGHDPNTLPEGSAIVEREEIVDYLISLNNKLYALRKPTHAARKRKVMV